jgi:hypothetical protein
VVRLAADVPGFNYTVDLLGMCDCCGESPRQRDIHATLVIASGYGTARSVVEATNWREIWIENVFREEKPAESTVRV